MRDEPDVLKAARDYVSRGWSVVPAPRGKKGAVLPNWPKLRLTMDDLPNHFSSGANVGILVGEPSNGLVDVDLDSSEAVRLAPKFLPPTDCIHGRPGKRNSHRWYKVDGSLKTEPFK